MKTLIKSKEKLSININNRYCSQQKGQYAISKNELDNKLYQKLFLAFFGCLIFLIFPESPKEAEILCNKYHSTQVCNVM